MKVWSRLYPNEYVTSIYHIDVKRLWTQGKRAIITDLDNTLVEWNSPIATPKLVAWLDSVRKIGFRVCIVSNNDKARVAAFVEPLGLPALELARKPRRRAFVRALQVMKSNAPETVMIGDQIFTDILGGNCMELHTILVRPLHPKEHFGTRMIRHLERLILRRMPYDSALAEVFEFSPDQSDQRSGKGKGIT